MEDTDKERLKALEAKLERLQALLGTMQHPHLTPHILELLYETMTDGVVGVSRDGRILFANPAMGLLTHRSVEYLVGKTPEEAWDENFMGQSGVFSITSAEVAVTNAEGVVRQAHVKSFEINTEPPVLIRIYRDITRRKRAEQELRRRESFFRALTEQASDWVVVLTEGYRVKYITPSVRRTLDLQEKQVIGEPLISFLAPEDHAPIARLLEEVLAAPETVYAAEFSTNPAFGPSRVVSAKLRNLLHLPDVQGIIINCSDITEKRRSVELQRRLERAVELTHEGVAIFSPAGIYEYANEAYAAIYRYPGPLSLLGKPWSIHFSGDLANSIVQEVTPSLEARGRWDGRLACQRSDGSALELEVSMTALENGGYISVCHDITERSLLERQKKELENQIWHAQKVQSLGLLASGIAHDFNNLLSGVVANAELAQADLGPGSPARPYLQQIEAAAQRMADLSHQMLAYSGRSKTVEDAQDLNTLVREMGHLLKASLHTGVELVYDLNDTLPIVIHGDGTQIRQVVMNLITNASDAIGETGGRIVIRTRRLLATEQTFEDALWGDNMHPGHYAMVSVEDNGCGMDEATLARIFEPFFTTKFTGRGLGLAAVQGILRAHRGTLKISSRKGDGTTFTLYLPAVAKGVPIGSLRVDRTTPLPVKLPPPAPAPVAARRQPLVLIIDDEESIRSVSKRALEKAEYRTLVAAEGKTGLELFTAHQSEIDLVLLDLTMPLIPGGELYTRVKQMKPTIPILIMSGFDESHALPRLPGVEPPQFLHKPFRIADLLGQVAEMIGAEAGEK